MMTIKKGSNGDAVLVAQALLGAGMTGSFDNGFYEAVVSFQAAHSLKPDGIIGAATWAAIAEAAPIVKDKRSGKSATQAAQLLLGFAGNDIDGICGQKTRARIIAYQASCGLSADGIIGRQTWNRLLGVSGDSSAGKCLNHCVHYIQWDKRWKNVKYSTHTAKQTIGNSGCGTTAMAMILATAIDPKITPVETSALSVKHGYRTESNGTAWSFYKFCFGQYPGFKKFVQTNSISVLKAALRDGALAVCSMNNGDNGFWTKQGHFITAIGCDDDYIYANDPNKSAHPRRQAQAKFKKCMKQAFIFWF